MSTRLTRRTFIGLASAAALAASGRTLARAQSWTLTADVVAVTLGFGLLVTFSVDFLDQMPLYIQVADSDGPDIFFTWEHIDEPTDAQVLDIDPFGIPFGRTYLVTIVTAQGEKHPLSPIVQVDVPAPPDAF